MRTRSIVVGLWLAVGGAAIVGATGCKDVTCGSGTIERNGACAPQDEAVGSAQCGPFTELQGDTCVPMFPPTMCDPTTTMANVDPSTGVTTCIGTGGGGCSAPFACPAPASGTQTICGQFFDFGTGEKFADAAATGAMCTAGATTGPCALGIAVVDPATGSPLTSGTISIDDCGRYRVPDIDVSGGVSPFVGLAVDDAAPAGMGPGGITEATAVATFKVANNTLANFDAYVIDPTMLWTGGPPISGGIYAMLFYAHSTGTALQAGVTVTKSGATIPAQVSYFTATDTTRGASDMIDAAATVTAANGTAFVTGASPSDGLVYGGKNDLQAGCTWGAYAGGSQPFVVFIQEIRPTAISGMTCNQ